MKVLMMQRLISLMAILCASCGLSSASEDRRLREAIAKSQLYIDEVHVAFDVEQRRIFHSASTDVYEQSDFTGSIDFRSEVNLKFLFQGRELNNGVVVNFGTIKPNQAIPILIRFEELEFEFGLVVTTLPIVTLDAPIIVDEPKKAGELRVMSGPHGSDTGKMLVNVEIRGGSARFYPKKSYGFEVESNQVGEDKVSLLGMRTDDDWILDGAYQDRSLIRNIVSHDIYNIIQSQNLSSIELEEQIGSGTIQGRVVELILNGQYRGIYILSERLDRKLLNLEKVSVPISSEGNELWTDVDLSNPQNGSVLYKTISQAADFYPDFRNEPKPVWHLGYEQKYPDFDLLKNWEPLDQFVEFTAVSDNDRFVKDIGQYIDLNSWADYLILVRLTSASDNVTINYYLGRNRDQQFFIKPWDMDRTWGDQGRGLGDIQSCGVSLGSGNNLWNKLIAYQDTGLMDKVSSRWSELRQSVLTADSILQHFKNYISAMETSGALERNFTMWPDSGFGNSDMASLEHFEACIIKTLSQLDSEFAPSEN